jgi:hypothetical protein
MMWSELEGLKLTRRIIFIVTLAKGEAEGFQNWKALMGPERQAHIFT